MKDAFSGRQEGLMPDDFQADAGNLTVIGRFLDHVKTCISSQVCQFDAMSWTNLC